MLIVRKILVWCAVAAALVILALFALPSYRQGEDSLAGKTANNFSMTLAGEPEQHLSDLKGKVVVLNFWASWCPPCVNETPSMINLQNHIAPKGGVILGASIDEDPDAYANFIKENGINFPTFRDPSKKISLGYGTSIIPETYIIDRHGKIARKIIGEQQWDSPQMLAYFDAILGSPSKN
jgi:cytochrome c biogenesis protein CcmG/thiol:disulfide interchange protein DsbE